MVADAVPFTVIVWSSFTVNVTPFTVCVVDATFSRFFAPKFAITLVSVCFVNIALIFDQK